MPPLMEDEEARQLGGRAVMAYDGSEELIPTIFAEWIEPNGNTVEVRAVGFTWPELDAIVSSLEPTGSDLWPNAERQERLQWCVDERSQYAPTIVPDGWNRFVMHIEPTGKCDVQPLLFMSLVEPGTATAQGKMVTIVVTPAIHSSPQPGALVEINGHEARLLTGSFGDGTPTPKISFVVDTVQIDAHGTNVDAETLQQIAATIAPVGDARWAQLVAEVQAPPLPPSTPPTTTPRIAIEDEAAIVAAATTAVARSEYLSSIGSMSSSGTALLPHNGLLLECAIDGLHNERNAAPFGSEITGLHR